MKHLTRLKQLEVYASEATKAFWAFDQAAWTEGSIAKKHKELIAVALKIQRPYCTELHVGREEEQSCRNLRPPKPYLPMPQCVPVARSLTAHMR